MASHSNQLPPGPTPLPAPLPPATARAPQPPAPPKAVHPAALLALLLADGIVEATATRVDFFLSDHEFIVNGQPQSAARRADYHRHLGQASGSTTAICLKGGQ